jgi:predicted nucleic acid-binding Zn ribbon protein
MPGKRAGKVGVGGIEGIGDVLRREIVRGARQRRRVDARVRAKWEEGVGPEIAARTLPVSFKGHVLRVSVDSSALLSELSGIYRKELVSAMAEGENAVSVRTVEFELAGASGA